MATPLTHVLDTIPARPVEYDASRQVNLLPRVDPGLAATELPHCLDAPGAASFRSVRCNLGTMPLAYGYDSTSSNTMPF